MTVNGAPVSGRGSAQDVLEASAKAFLNAVNRVFFNQNSAVKETAKSINLNKQKMRRLLRMKKQIVLLPGDGIGKEVINSAKEVLNAIAEEYNHTFSFETHEIGGAAIDLYGTSAS